MYGTETGLWGVLISSPKSLILLLDELIFVSSSCTTSWQESSTSLIKWISKGWNPFSLKNVTRNSFQTRKLGYAPICTIFFKILQKILAPLEGRKIETTARKLVFQNHYCKRRLKIDFGWLHQISSNCYVHTVDHHVILPIYTWPYFLQFCLIFACVSVCHLFCRHCLCPY